ncbi:MAG: sensor histidine kinase [Actinobacteria bacterium ATB1]|nr:sensor histidine kinase [Actinobacteria bacterium ATB1]
MEGNGTSAEDPVAFVRALVHELRSAIGAVSGFTRLARDDLESRHPECLDGEVGRYLVLIAEAGARSERLLADALDYTARTSGPPNVKDVELGRVADEVRARLERDLRRTGGRFHADVEGVHIAADPEMLADMLEELVGNSLRFTRDAAPLIVLSASELEGGHVLTVADNGRGFRPEMTERLFDLFCAHGERAGTGTGLAICRRIVDMHGGTIRITSVPGNGTVVAVEFPAPRGAEAETDAL